MYNPACHMTVVSLSCMPLDNSPCQEISTSQRFNNSAKVREGVSESGRSGLIGLRWGSETITWNLDITEDIQLVCTCFVRQISLSILDLLKSRNITLYEHFGLVREVVKTYIYYRWSGATWRTFYVGSNGAFCMQSYNKADLIKKYFILINHKFTS